MAHWFAPHFLGRTRPLFPADNPYGAAGKEALKGLINQRYDRVMYSGLVDEYYDHSGFHNFGYWTPATRSQKEASENLVDVLLQRMPDKFGRILDVACGMGASTERLLRYYAPADIFGINISERQLATCRHRVPGVRFIAMDATELEFPDNSFENILCVEAAFHFDTREQFLSEAYRVLKPGGCLALSDILLRSWQAARLVKRVPLANFQRDPEAYLWSCERIGFAPVDIDEARSECWEGFRNHSLAFLWKKAAAGVVPWRVLRQVARGSRCRDWLLSNYLLVWATKPLAYRIGSL
jgi:MPBQ/MSBQ methyltransferase